IIIILLALTLFFAFNSYNLILAVVWTISRSIEGLIQIYNKKRYWELLNIARKYSVANDGEKKSLNDIRLSCSSWIFICTNLFFYRHSCILNTFCSL
ncbi:hypothetical protein ACFL1L_04985, partial [Thermoplasmatota archaeon]